MKTLIEMNVNCDQDGSNHHLCNEFEKKWNRKHAEQMKDKFLLLPSTSPVLQLLKEEFARFNANVEQALTLDEQPRVVFEQLDYDTASMFCLSPQEEVGLVQIPSHPQWVYRKDTGCTVCNVGDPLPLDEYAKSLSDFRLAHLKMDMAYTPEMVTVVSERTLELIKEFGRSQIRWYPVATATSARKRARGHELFHLLEVTERVGGSLLEPTDVRTSVCSSCGRVTNRIYKGAIHIRMTDLPKADILRSQELFGHAAYCDWMSPLELISRRLADALKAARITGYTLEPCVLK